MATYRFTGDVLNKATSLPASGVRVEAMDLHKTVLEPVCVGVSDSSGVVEMAVSDETLRHLFGSAQPCLYFRLLSAGGSIVGSTEATVRWDGRQNKRARMLVDTAAALGEPPEPSYVVEGSVTDLAGDVVEGAEVRVYMVTLNSSAAVVESLKGTTTTDDHGNFSIRYAPGTSNVSARPRLAVKVMDESEVLALASVCRAAPRSKVDLVVGGVDDQAPVEPTERARIGKAILSVADDIALFDADADGIALLACQTDVSGAAVAAYINAGKLWVAHTEIEYDVFFAFTRHGIAASDDAVFAHRLPALRRIIEEAASSHVIRPGAAEEATLDATMAALQTAALTALRATGGDKLRLGRAVDLATGTGITVGHRDAFLIKALTFEGSAEAFWAAVDDDPEISETAARHFKFMVEASGITGAYEPLVTALYAEFDGGTLGSPPLNASARGIAALSVAELTTLIDDDFPEALYETAEEYAEAVSAMAEARFRTAKIRSQVSPSSAAGEFFAAQASFEFENGRLQRYLNENSGWETGLTDAAASKLALEKLERLYRITDTYAQMTTLQAEGVESAHDAHELGVNGLKAIFTGPNAEEYAQLVYMKACWTTNASTAMLSKYSPSVNAKVVGNIIPSSASMAAEELPAKIADWETLFGTLDQCECKHCGSVLSPSAYLVDVLQMLKRVGPSGANARDELLDRRPDLALVGLTCENAHTPMPYVDLVNEILEVRVADPTPFPESPNPIVTTATAEELAAHPEVLYPVPHVEAYNRLDAQVHPFVLPWNLWQDEARVYLDHLGVSRSTLVEAFTRPSEVDETPSADVLDAIAIERLRVSNKQYEVITGAASEDAHAYWGLEPGTWTTELAKVSVFMLKSGLSFQEVRDLFGTQYCAGAGIAFDDGPCDLESMEIVGLNSDPERSMLHRLVRLRNALGFSIADTDRARVALGETLDVAAVQKVASLKALLERRPAAPRVGMTWFADIDVHGQEGDASLFQRVFLDRKATSPSYPAFQELLTDATPEEHTLGDVRAALVGGLGLSDAELMLLVDSDTAQRELGLDSPHELADFLSRANVSQLFAAATFARAHNRPLADIIVLAALAGGASGTAPVRGLGAASVTAMPESALAFEKTVARFSRTGLTVTEVQHILRGFSVVGSGLGLSEEDLSRLDGELLDEVEKAANEAKDVSDPDGQIVEALGGLLLGDEPTTANVTNATWLLDRATYTIDTGITHGLTAGDWVTVAGVAPAGYNVTTQVQSVHSATSFSVTLVGNPGTFVSGGTADCSAARGLAKLRAIIERSSTVSGLSTSFAAAFLGDATDADAQLVGNDRLTSVELRRTYVAQRLSRYVNCRATIIAWLARTFELEVDVAAQLAGTGPNGTADVLSVETSVILHESALAVRALMPSTAWTTPAETEAADRQALLTRFERAALLVRRTQLTAGDLAILYPAGEVSTTGLPTLDLNELPITDAEDQRVAFEELLRLGDYTWVRSRYPGREAGLARLFAVSGEATPHVERLVEDTGLSREDVERLALRFLSSVAGADFKNDKLLLRLFESIELLRRLGAPAVTVLGATEATALQGWRNVLAPLPTAGDPEDPAENALLLAREIKAAARSKHSDEAWAKVGKEVRDPLRDKQRVALSQALVGRLGLSDTNALFEKLLIDVEMSPCAITSRIVCAHGSVQTFVNRIQLNLESGAGFSPSKALSREWDWMHAYRLWEANRKVFLWPENWIEPELRDSKTPLFEELETSLLQGPLTEAAVEDAYTKYLDGLADVANLEIVALHEETVDALAGGGVRAVHVLGRTPNPHRYYHRVKTGQGWAPWTKLDIDVDTDHLLPIAVNGTLYLFWTQIEDVRNDAVEVGEGDPTPLGCNVSLGVAQSRRGAWSVLIGRSAPVRLAASVDRARLCLTGKLVANEVRLQLLYQGEDDMSPSSWAYELSEFVFSLASRTVAARDAVEVKPYWGGALGDYESNVTSIEVEQEEVTVHAGGWASFQDFRALNNPTLNKKGQLYARLMSGVLALYPLVRHEGARLVVSRRTEPVGERKHLVFQGGEGSFHLQLRSQKVLPSTPLGPVLVQPTEAAKGQEIGVARFYEAQLFHHPYVNEFRARVSLRGLDGLLRPRDSAYAVLPQYLAEATEYEKELGVPANFPELEVQFNAGTAYGDYNWELFFHAPFLIANRLHQEGRYAEARRWYHVIFDPTCGWEEPEEGEGAPPYNEFAQFWKFKPFAENTDLASIQAQLTLSIGSPPLNEYGMQLQSWADGHPESALSDSLKQQIAVWRNDPFDPHAIARLRIVAYQKAVVQKYIENLVAWGDQLFTQSTMESVNEATQLYIHALQLLGPRPTVVSKPVPVEPVSYEGMPVDAFSNPLIVVETIAPPFWGEECLGMKPGLSTVYGSAYFCVPQNEKLFGLWDLIEDRLFKIRHCQSIDGVVRALPLFQPPIDPALLVRAAAAGVDLRTVMNDLYVSAPPYRYVILAARAMEYSAALTSLGGSVLAALEKEDSEELARLRAGHDVATQRLSRDIRAQQVAEAKESLAAATRLLEATEARHHYYASRDFMSGGEIDAEALTRDATREQSTADAYNRTAALLAMVPNFGTGGAGVSSPRVVTEFGGIQLSTGAAFAGEAHAAAARAISADASAAMTTAGYRRRMDDWKFEAAQAKIEISQLEKQIVAAEIRVAIAEHELKLVEQQIDQVKAVEDFLKSKFTNRELYGWMKGQLAAVYQQSYQLAYEMARHAERAFQVERGDTSQTFIKFGAWDGFRRGLMAGEKLALDIRRMDAAYHTQNVREHELVKTISIAQLNPDAFMALRGGSTDSATTSVYRAEFSLPESIFDDDFPNHHMRRLKNVNVTVQCTPGPYQSVSGKLTLLKSDVRLKPQSSAMTEDLRIAEIATSSASNDGGMFEMNFRDERYLPFEYRGVSCANGSPTAPYGPGQWRFELLGGNEMDFDSITDLVVQLRYTAREGRSVPGAGSTKRSILRRVPSAHADAWAAFKTEAATEIVLALKDGDFPRGKRRALAADPVKRVVVYARWTNNADKECAVVAPVGWEVDDENDFVGVYRRFIFTPESGPGAAATQDWSIQPNAFSTLQDLWVAFHYELAP